SELCQRGWIPFKEKCYLFSSMFCKTWKECQHFCQEMGADVAVIDNLQEWVSFYYHQYGLNLLNGITEKRGTNFLSRDVIIYRNSSAKTSS
ncbi:hypothetical protein GOODEAATRI_017638, partial [Goodea atripinnis]